MEPVERSVFMRWIKHLTNTSTDPKITKLIDLTGNAGYGVWWHVLETVAAQIGSSQSCEVTHPLRAWSTFLWETPEETRKYLQVLHQLGLIVMSEKDGDVTVSIPNLLKFRDEWSERIAKSHSGATPEKLGRNSRKELEVELDTELDKELHTSIRTATLREEFEKFRVLWNTAAETNGWPTCRELTPSREAHFRKRCAHPEYLKSLPRCVEIMSKSEFFLEKWKPSIDFLIERQDKWIKVLEGGYGGTESAPPAGVPRLKML